MKIYTGADGEKRIRIGLHEELPPEQQAENERLKAEYDARNPEGSIDTEISANGLTRSGTANTDDIPDLSDDAEFWELATVGWPPPQKTKLSLRLDTETLEWFKGKGRRYQSRINAVLRQYVEAQKREEAKDQGHSYAEKAS
jgi:uncharacterized protein (DUF4415 family)